MFDLNKKHLKIATKLGASVTILVLLAACSSKEIVNEAAVLEPIEYTDTAADQNPYIDQSELPVREQEAREISKSKRPAIKKNKKKSSRKPIARKKIEKRQHIEKRHEVAQQSFDSQIEEAALPAIGSVDNTQPPVPPAPPALDIGADSSADQALYETESSADFSGLILENWHYLLGLLALGLGSFFGFKFFQKRFLNRRKSKRRLVFN
jgi:hypothetical protein